jgi:hypothetical protein
MQRLSFFPPGNAVPAFVALTVKLPSQRGSFAWRHSALVGVCRGCAEKKEKIERAAYNTPPRSPVHALYNVRMSDTCTSIQTCTQAPHSQCYHLLRDKPRLRSRSARTWRVQLNHIPNKLTYLSTVTETGWKHVWSCFVCMCGATRRLPARGHVHLHIAFGYVCKSKLDMHDVFILGLLRPFVL